MNRQALYFTGPLRVEVREELAPQPGPGEMLVKSLVSAISAGTELLFYRGQVPQELEQDETIASLQTTGGYPLKYGYACVGEVIAQGAQLQGNWLGRRVFCFHPHETLFCASPAEVMAIPDGMPPERAVFLANMETALNFVLDGQALVGERVGVFGLGVVGLLTCAVLRAFPLDSLAAFDRYPLRREAALGLGVDWALDPQDESAWWEVEQGFGAPTGLDMAFEVSGAPGALDQAVERSGYAGRVVIGSWYGTKLVSLNLGGKFHRSRIHLVSSQVSSIAPGLTGRWDKARRFRLAWDQLNRICPERWITHRFPLEAAVDAYKLLENRPAEVIQVVFTYEPRR